MNERIHYEDLTATGAEHWPRVDVVVINSRGVDNPWFQQGLGSLRMQRYPNAGVVVVDNNDHALTIGGCWNLATQYSQAEFLQFMGDDDYIAYDLLMSEVAFFQYHERQGAGDHLVMVTSGCTAIDADGRVMARMDKHHTGMFKRSWLLDHPFNATRHRFVDTEMHERLSALQRLRNQRISTAMVHHFGYFYRQHPTMVSGEKVTYQPQQAPQLRTV